MAEGARAKRALSENDEADVDVRAKQARTSSGLLPLEMERLPSYITPASDRFFQSLLGQTTADQLEAQLEACLPAPSSNDVQEEPQDGFESHSDTDSLGSPGDGDIGLQGLDNDDTLHLSSDDLMINPDELDDFDEDLDDDLLVHPDDLEDFDDDLDDDLVVTGGVGSFGAPEGLLGFSAGSGAVDDDSNLPTWAAAGMANGSTHHTPAAPYTNLMSEFMREAHAVDEAVMGSRPLASTASGGFYSGYGGEAGGGGNAGPAMPGRSSFSGNVRTVGSGGGTMAAAGNGLWQGIFLGGLIPTLPTSSSAGASQADISSMTFSQAPAPHPPVSAMVLSSAVHGGLGTGQNNSIQGQSRALWGQGAAAQGPAGGMPSHRLSHSSGAGSRQTLAPGPSPSPPLCTANPVAFTGQLALQQPASSGSRGLTRYAAAGGPSGASTSAGPSISPSLSQQQADASDIPAVQCMMAGCKRRRQLASDGTFRFCRQHLLAAGGMPARPMCEVKGCDRYARLSAEPGAIRKYCAKHMEAVGLQPLSSGPPCAHPHCHKLAQQSTSGVRLFCPLHMAENGLKLEGVMCSHDGCCRMASYSSSGECKYCVWHMREHGLQPMARFVACEEPGCRRQSALSSSGLRKYCRGHMAAHGLQPMVDTPCQQDGCTRQAMRGSDAVGPYAGLCRLHARAAGYRPSYNPTCAHDACSKVAQYSTCGVRMYCDSHMRAHGQQPRPSRTCGHAGCSASARLTAEGSTAYCREHMKAAGLVAAPSNKKRCAHEACTRYAKRSVTGEWLYCKAHMRAQGIVSASTAAAAANAAAKAAAQQAQIAATGGAGPSMPAAQPAPAQPRAPPSDKRRCHFEACIKWAKRSTTGVSLYCKAHMKEKGLQPLSSIKRCAHENCTHAAKPDTNGKWLYCKGHMQQYGMWPRDYKSTPEQASTRARNAAKVAAANAAANTTNGTASAAPPSTSGKAQVASASRNGSRQKKQPPTAAPVPVLRPGATGGGLSEAAPVGAATLVTSGGGVSNSLQGLHPSPAGRATPPLLSDQHTSSSHSIGGLPMGLLPSTASGGGTLSQGAWGTTSSNLSVRLPLQNSGGSHLSMQNSGGPLIMQGSHGSHPPMQGSSGGHLPMQNINGTHLPMQGSSGVRLPMQSSSAGLHASASSLLGPTVVTSGTGAAPNGQHRSTSPPRLSTNSPRHGSWGAGTAFLSGSPLSQDSPPAAFAWGQGAFADAIMSSSGLMAMPHMPLMPAMPMQLGSGPMSGLQMGALQPAPLQTVALQPTVVPQTAAGRL